MLRQLGGVSQGVLNDQRGLLALRSAGLGWEGGCVPHRRIRLRLADLPHEGVKIVQGFDALLLEQFFQFVPVKSQRNLLDLFYLFKEVYTVFLTLLIWGAV
jgi:hypothetical protein